MRSYWPYYAVVALAALLYGGLLRGAEPVCRAGLCSTRAPLEPATSRPVQVAAHEQHEPRVEAGSRFPRLAAVRQAQPVRTVVRRIFHR